MNLEKLRHCILHAYYIASKASIPSLHISTDARDVFLDILENKFNDKLFNKLKSPDEQRLISTFVRLLKLPISMVEFDDAYQLRFQTLKGIVDTGNSNPQVKAELKLFILRGITESLIPKSQGQLLLYNLSL